MSTTGGTAPACNRNGREVFYIDAASNMVSVPIIPGPAFQIGAPQALFSAAQFSLNRFFRKYDVSPDGKRVVMIRGESDAAAHVVVGLNFLEELKRMMATP